METIKEIRTMEDYEAWRIKYEMPIPEISPKGWQTLSLWQSREKDEDLYLSLVQENINNTIKTLISTLRVLLIYEDDQLTTKILRDCKFLIEHSENLDDFRNY